MYSSEDLELLIKNKGNSILPRQPFIIEQLSIAGIAENYSTFKIQNSTLRTAHNSTSAKAITQHSTFNTQHCRRLQSTIDQLSIACVAANNSTLNIQNSKFLIGIVKRRIFLPTSAEPNLFELCRVQPKITCV